MSERKLHILGSSALVPTHTRNHNGYFLKWDKEGFLFDPGEGTQRQMTFAGISASSITKIFISHFHGDHCLGLPGIIQRLSLDKVPRATEIFFPASGQAYYENLKNASSFYMQTQINDNPVESSGVIFKDNKFTITALKLDHTIESFGYRIEESSSYTMFPDKLEKAGIKGIMVKELLNKGHININDKTTFIKDVSTVKDGQSMAFIMDTRICDAAYKLADKVDLMICESTYLSKDEKLAESYGHLTAVQAANIAQKAGVKKLVLTHFSQRYNSTDVFLEEASKIFPNVIIANDGKKISMPENKRKI